MSDRHVRRRGADYSEAFLSLLPQGQAWPRHPESTLVLACQGLNEYWGFVDGRAADLLERESDPRQTIELLPEWERAWGLPDECLPGGNTLEQRRKMLLFKMTLLGSQSRTFFEYVAQLFGYKINIIEHAPFMAGVSQAGSVLDEKGKPRWEIGPPEIRFYWSIHEGNEALFWFRAGSGQAGVDPHLTIIRTGFVECIFERWKPAHTQIVFDYSGIDNSDYMDHLYD